MTESRGHGKLAFIVVALVAGPTSWLLLSRIARLKGLEAPPAPMDDLSGKRDSSSVSSEEARGARLSCGGQRWALRPAGTPYGMGSADDNSIRIVHEDIAPYQALIDFTAGNWILVPLPSKNPVLVNGNEALQPTPLAHASMIKIEAGPVVMFHSSRGIGYAGIPTGLAGAIASWSLNSL